MLWLPSGVIESILNLTGALPRGPEGVLMLRDAYLQEQHPHWMVETSGWSLRRQFLVQAAEGIESLVDSPGSQNIQLGTLPFSVPDRRCC